MSGRRFTRDGNPIRKGARPRKAPLLPDGLKKLKNELAYEEAMAAAAEEAPKLEARRAKELPPSPPRPSAAGDCDFQFLDIILQAAVPVWIDRFKDMPVESVLNLKRLAELGDVIAEHGDIVMYRSKKKGATAETFNRLAEALARLAFAQGGVTFNGVHYEALARSA